MYYCFISQIFFPYSKFSSMWPSIKIQLIHFFPIPNLKFSKIHVSFGFHSKSLLKTPTQKTNKYIKITLFCLYKKREIFLQIPSGEMHIFMLYTLTFLSSQKDKIIHRACSKSSQILTIFKSTFFEIYKQTKHIYS